MTTSPTTPNDATTFKTHASHAPPSPVAAALTARLPARRAEEDFRQLFALVQGGGEAAKVLEQFVQQATALREVAAAAYLLRDSDGRLMVGPNTLLGPLFQAPSFQEKLLQVAATACQSGSVQMVEGPARNVRICCLPIPLATGDCEAFAVSMLAESGEAIPDLASVRLIASAASQWRMKQQARASEQQLTNTAAALELLGALHRCEDSQQAALALVSCVQRHLGGVVIFGWANRWSEFVRTSAISGIAEIQRSSPATRAADQLLNECLLQPQGAEASSPGGAAPAMGHRQAMQHFGAEAVLSGPLRASDGALVGAWACLGSKRALQPVVQGKWWRAVTPRLADALHTIRRAGAKPQLRKSATRRRVAWLGVVVAILAVAAAAPAPHHIAADCVVEPVLRRFVVAPHDGLLLEVKIQPGDRVAAGELLAQMDGRQVRWELAGLQAQREQAAKQRDIDLIAGNIAAAQQAELELQQISVRSNLLEDRRRRLDIRSPIHGVVLAGDLERVANAPVKVGQSLFEIAPLDQVIAEIAIPAEDLPHIRDGAAVQLRLEGLAEKRSAVIRDIHPRSEVRDQQNVFIAEVVLDNVDRQLQPGMFGSAQVESTPKRLAWILLHKPWERLQVWLAW